MAQAQVQPQLVVQEAMKQGITFSNSEKDNTQQSNMILNVR
jgi:hypothetical protein